MLEDESGRIRLVGEKVHGSTSLLVSGIILAVLGVETSGGDFEALDICYPGAAEQIPLLPSTTQSQMDVDCPEEWVALASGLNIGTSSTPLDLRVNLLVEQLLSETGDAQDQSNSSVVTHLILAGDSLAPLPRHDLEEPDTTVIDGGPVMRANPASKRQAQEDAPFSPHPTYALAGHLSELCRALSVHILPGATDPAGSILPQQPMPRNMFGEARLSESFHTETNPCWLGVGSCE